MLKRDPNAKFLYRDVGLFKKRRLYRFHTGNIYSQKEYEQEEYRSIVEAQQYEPVAILYDSSRKRRWWVFKGEYYWEDEGYSATEVMVLILDRMQQKKKKLENALSRVNNQTQKSVNGRQPIPNDVKMFVWQRDRGRCVRCGSQENLEYDHIIPVSKGGSNTARNIQLLCEKCNRSKGANLY